MNWLVMLLIALVTTIIVLSTCGVGGGLMALVALNGFSELAAMPILVLFALIVIGISIALSTTASWIFVKARHAENDITLWRVAGINAVVNILIILVVIAIIAIARKG